MSKENKEIKKLLSVLKDYEKTLTESLKEIKVNSLEDFFSKLNKNDLNYSELIKSKNILENITTVRTLQNKIILEKEFEILENQNNYKRIKYEKRYNYN